MEVLRFFETQLIAPDVLKQFESTLGDVNIEESQGVTLEALYQVWFKLRRLSGVRNGPNTSELSQNQAGQIHNVILEELGDSNHSFGAHGESMPVSSELPNEEVCDDECNPVPIEVDFYTDIHGSLEGTSLFHETGEIPAQRAPISICEPSAALINSDHSALELSTCDLQEEAVTLSPQGAALSPQGAALSPQGADLSPQGAISESESNAQSITSANDLEVQNNASYHAYNPPAEGVLSEEIAGESSQIKECYAKSEEIRGE
ncbi:hypothetical protein QAD02_023465 [Eretmocerus hayati]|uniref:Uncharacterized protein n=1 Tax=Eretmocerus hayati TaxID=131215 RepID=A0ACC2PY16_9HYME|nr:hypothetical protein QAD02_023465 [Eretmocerus hayati]